jgi:ATP-dependent Clp protease protease subunit
MILSAGNKGKRFMTPHATAMLHQPKVPSTGERQATELQIKWKEVKAQKQVLVDILTKTTGHPADKIDKVSGLGFFFVLSYGINQDIQRPLYMTAKDAIAYGIVDKIIDKPSETIDKVLSTSEWDSAAGLVQKSVA